jgi:hypothetical protein
MHQRQAHERKSAGYFASHTETPVNDDPWSHWKAFAARAQHRPQRDAFTPLLDAAESFEAAARKFLEAAARAPSADEAARTFGHFLREQSMVFFQPPWSAPASAGGAPWAAVLDAPALGLTREHQQRWQRTADAARRVADAQRRLQCLWSDALRDAATAFASRLAASAPAVPQAGAAFAATLRSLYDAWIDCAEQAYAGMAHGEPFCDTLADFVNAESQWRREFAASVEHWSKLMDLPTRSELNSLTLRLKSAEDELHAQHRQRELREEAAGRRPAARPPRARRAKRNPKS